MRLLELVNTAPSLAGAGGVVLGAGPVARRIPLNLSVTNEVKEGVLDKFADGALYGRVHPYFSYIPDLSGRYLSRWVDDFLSPLDEGTFIRVVNDKADYSRLLKGRHRGSTNWHTGEPELGLSVARDFEIPRKYAYLVRGRKIGQGSDYEPLLETATATPVSDLMPYQGLYDKIRKMEKEKAKKMGISDEDLRLIKSLRFDYKIR